MGDRPGRPAGHRAPAELARIDVEISRGRDDPRNTESPAETDGGAGDLQCGGGAVPASPMHCAPVPQLTTPPHPSGWKPHFTLHGFFGTHAEHVPSAKSQRVPAGHAAHSMFPLQPSGPPHAPAGKVVHAFGVQQEPLRHVSPLWQSPQCFDTPQDQASPQKRPLHEGGAQGPHAPA